METSMTNSRPVSGAVESERTDEARSTGVLSIDLDLLDDNPYQPRAERDELKAAELRESIAREGQLQPILVRPMGSRWQIIFGHGRVEALRTLRHDASTEAERSHFSQVRAEERSDVSDDQMLMLALVENVQREDLSPVDCAAALDRLKSLRPDLKTVRQIAAEVHMERPRVKRLLRLHAAPAIIKDAVSKGRSVLVKAGADESDGEMERGDEPNPPAASGARTRETRRLDLCSALELAKLHAHWTEQSTDETVAKEGTPDERVSRLIDLALQQDWGLRRMQAVVAKLSLGESEDSEREDPSRSSVDSSPFKANGKQILIYPTRVDQMSDSQKAELRDILEPIWNRIVGSSPRPLPHDRWSFSPARWRESLRLWTQVVQGFRKLATLLAQNAGQTLPPQKRLGAGQPSYDRQLPAAASAAPSQAPQIPATVKGAVTKEVSSTSNAA